jgi:predicted Zn-dependent protease with MMP-like domain
VYSKLTQSEFEGVAQAAFESLPEDFRERVDNVHIVVEDYPSDEALRQTHTSRSLLLGLYQGVPLPHRGTWYGSSPTAPDKISLYKKNIEEVCSNEEELIEQIREVLFHELGHYFGMNEKEIRSAMRNFH